MGIGNWLVSWVSRGWREVRYRVAAASKTQFALDLANMLALAYQFWASLTFATQGASAFSSKVPHPWLFFLALSYATAHRLILRDRFQGRKWQAEAARRSEFLAVGISALANAFQSGCYTEVAIDRIEHNILQAMLSEVEATVLDSQGVYINLNLLVEDPTDAQMLLCLNRARRNRPLHSRYPKGQMAAWLAMRERQREYVPEFTADLSKPYRCILAYPVLSRDGGSDAAIGAISIDSAVLHHFDGCEAILETKLLPHLTLLKLLLIIRRGHNLWGT